MAISPRNVIENERYGSVPLGLNGRSIAGDTLLNCSWALVNKNSSLSFKVTILLSFPRPYLLTLSLSRYTLGTSSGSLSTEVFWMIFWVNSNLIAPMIKFLKHLILAPKESLSLGVSDSLSLCLRFMLINCKHLEAATLSSLTILHEYLMLYDLS